MLAGASKSSVDWAHWICISVLPSPKLYALKLAGVFGGVWSFGLGGRVVTVTGALNGDQKCPSSRPRMVKMYVVCGCRNRRVVDRFGLGSVEGSPFKDTW